MINADLIREVLAMYKKHGWDLRRVLLTENTAEAVRESAAELFGAAETEMFEKDAAWFSRPSKEGEAWEIRLLGPTPYALIDIFGQDQDESQREAVRRSMEEKLLAANPPKIDLP